MQKTTGQLQPGDIIYINGKRAVVEMISPDLGTNTIHVRHTYNGGWFREDAIWLVESPLDDILDEVDSIINGVQ